MPQDSVMVTCKRCGKQAPSDQFTLDHIYNMLVCASCVKERKAKSILKPQTAQESVAPEKVPEKIKPKGWDQVDEALEREAHMKEKMKPQVEPVEGDKVRYKCLKCRYTFTYDPVKKMPTSCPYCGSAVNRNF